jgi:hypothetical protein
MGVVASNFLAAPGTQLDKDLAAFHRWESSLLGKRLHHASHELAKSVPSARDFKSQRVQESSESGP